MKGIVIIVLVVAALIGGIMTLRSTRGAGMPDKDVLARARAREKAQSAKDESDADQ